MLKHFLLILAVVIGIQAATICTAEEKRPEVGRYVKAYSGTENIKVWTVRIGPRSNNEALVQVGGVDHDWDMKIMKVKVEPTSYSRDQYVAKADGRPFVVLILGDGQGEVHLPGINGVYPVSYDKYLSEQSNPEHFLTDYLQQGGK